ncbi:hypothetical protein [Streptomyces sp. NPDC020965]|uniref:hypothetical protein n=1 Tax=Streptomyces sp. NPDC020965 TaxID=3365105 RepID=UPI0037AA0797
MCTDPLYEEETVAELDARIKAYGAPRDGWAELTPGLVETVHSALVERRDRMASAQAGLEPVPVDGCTFCRSLARHRENCRGAGDLASVLACSEEIQAHPHCASLSEMGE